MTTTASSPEVMVQRPSKMRWLWALFGFGVVLAGRQYMAGRYFSAMTALCVWMGAEFAIYRGINPLIGPWAKKGSARAQVLRLLWPLWRLGFALNVGLLFFYAHLVTGSQWIALASLAPWVIFTCLGVTSALLHNLAGSPDVLGRWMMQARHVMYLVIGFGPFGMTCIMGTILVPFIKLYSLGDALLTQRRARRMGQFVFRNILRYLELIGFIKVRFRDVSGYTTGPRLIVGNHISMFDIITTLAFVDQCGTFVKAKYAHMPIMKQVIYACGFIPIDPESHESRQLGMKRAREALRRGETLVVWPEGTRTKDGTLGAFHNGVFRLALETSVDITPALFTSNGPVFNNLGALRETQGTITFRAEIEPPVALAHSQKVTPGRVLIARDLVKNYFLERLTRSDVPLWMRLTPSPSVTGGSIAHE